MVNQATHRLRELELLISKLNQQRDAAVRGHIKANEEIRVLRLELAAANLRVEQLAKTINVGP